MKTIYCLLMTLFCSSTLFATDYTVCNENQAYTNPDLKHREPAKDYICQASPAPNNVRCVRLQERLCQNGNEKGPHDVPNGGNYWFLAFGIDGNVDYKCTCGCFMKGTEISGEYGIIEIQHLFEAAKYQNVRVLVRKNISEKDLFKLSKDMKANHFTVGPEEEPLVVIHADNGRSLYLTTKHPVLIKYHNDHKMIRAIELKKGDSLLDEDGNNVPVNSIERFSLAKDDSNVYNFSTPNNQLTSHIVIANSLQVGDNKLQMALDIQKSREDNRLNGDTSYLLDFNNDGKNNEK